MGRFATAGLLAATFFVIPAARGSFQERERPLPQKKSGGSPAAQKAPKQIYRENEDAIVFVQGKRKAGSGFFISADGKIVTNYHVVSGETAVSVKLGDGLTVLVEDVVAQDSRSDLVILQLKGNRFKAVKLGDSDRVVPGDSVIVIGNPLGLEKSISNGLVSGLRQLEDQRFLQITAPISPGSSGGPVFDANGDVVGVADATVREGQNVNLAIPANEIGKLLRTPSAEKLSDLSPYPHAATASQESAKLKLYLQNEMWDEALEALKGAVSEDEFDPVLRFALGEVLIGMGDYEQAIREFQIARKLDPNLWQATQRLADAHLKRWEVKKSLPDRVVACQLYQEVQSSQLKGDQDKSERLRNLFPKWHDETSARAEAQTTLARLESAAGTWISEVGEAYILTVNGRGWGLGPVDRKPEQLRAYATTPATGDTLFGEGVTTLAQCIFVQSVEIHISEHSTKIEVVATPRKGVSTDPSKPVREACQDVVGVFVGEPLFGFKGVRSE